MNKRVLFLILLISTPVVPRRGGGSSPSRGQSEARRGGERHGGNTGSAQGGGYRPPNQLTLTHPPQYWPQPVQQPRYQPPPVQPPQYQPLPVQPPRYQPAPVQSSKGGGSWKTALAAGALGAVGGVVAWEAGKAIIRNHKEPISHGGRNYYWDKGYQQQSGMITCSMPLSEMQAATAGPRAVRSVTEDPTTMIPTEATASSTTATVDPHWPALTTAAPTIGTVIDTAATEASTTTSTTAAPPVDPNAPTSTTIAPLVDTTTTNDATTTSATAAPSATSPNATTTVAPSPPPPVDQVFSTIQYQDGSRPKTVSWSCRAASEVCCGMECCTKPPPPTTPSPPVLPSSSTGGGGGSAISSFFQILTLVMFVCLLLLCIVGCIVVYKCLTCWQVDEETEQCNQGQDEHLMQEYTQQQQPQQCYQPSYDQHNPNGYPPQNQFPNQG